MDAPQAHPESSHCGDGGRNVREIEDPRCRTPVEMAAEQKHRLAAAHRGIVLTGLLMCIILTGGHSFAPMLLHCFVALPIFLLDTIKGEPRSVGPPLYAAALSAVCVLLSVIVRVQYRKWYAARLIFLHLTSIFVSWGAIGIAAGLTRPVGLSLMLFGGSSIPLIGGMVRYALRSSNPRGF